MDIVIPYTPRPVFIPIHEGLESHRYSVIVAHRRMGKSVALINHIIKCAILNTRKQPAPRYAFIQPQLKQAKLNAWEYLKFYTKKLPGFKASESELFVQFLGRKIYLFGADNPDALRGGYLDGAVMDEYGDMDPSTFNEVVYPMLSDYKGWVVFSGTPKGLNDFYQKAMQAQEDKDWFYSYNSVETSGVFHPEEIAEIKKNMPPSAFAQEYMCDFQSSGEDTLIPLEDIAKASNRRILDSQKEFPLILGVDVARFGDDSTVLSPRRGLIAYPQIKYRQLDNMQVVDKITAYVARHDADMVFVDEGRGEGVIDRLHQMGYSCVVGIPFGSAARDFKRYENKRAEMWFEMAEWIKTGSIPNDSSLRTDLSAPRYKYSRNGRIMLESKAEIKDRLKRSPDGGDALALTFAMPVVGSKHRRMPKTYSTKYDFFPQRRR